jgi:aerobic-type carbon monoxide dehydrogenase small subunit (CoxS/CutS family)
VLLDGAVVDACLVPICQVDGADVRTVEGLARGRKAAEADVSVSADDLDTLQAAFLQTGGAQCGICTPGMLIAGHAFLASGAAPTEEAIREAIAGNLCRCTGYTKIVEAIALAASGPVQASGPVEAG